MKSTLTLLEESWNLIKTRYKTLAPLALAVAVPVSVANTLFPFDAIGLDVLSTHKIPNLLTLVALLIIQIASILGSALVLQTLLHSTQTLKTRLHAVGKKAGSLILVAILGALALIPFLMVPFFIPSLSAVALAGIILWIIPTLIISMFFLAAPLIILDGEKDARTAIKTNFNLIKTRFLAATAAYVGPLVLWTIVLLLFGFVAGILVNLGSSLLLRVLPLSVTNTATLGVVTMYAGSALFETLFLLVSSAVLFVWYKNLTE